MNRDPVGRDGGAAVVEFIVVAVVLLVPVALAVAVTVQVLLVRITAQSAAAAAALAVSRDGPRVATSTARRFLPHADVRWWCDPGCGRPGALVTVRVSQDVELPTGTLAVAQEQTQVADRYVTP